MLIFKKFFFFFLTVFCLAVWNLELMFDYQVAIQYFNFHKWSITAFAIVLPLKFIQYVMNLLERISKLKNRTTEQLREKKNNNQTMQTENYTATAHRQI